jgi:cytochrome c peroxidase
LAVVRLLFALSLLVVLSLLVASAAAQQEPVTEKPATTEQVTTREQAVATPKAAAPAQLQPSFAFLQVPEKGLPKMPMPADYQPTAAMFALGQQLFHDGILSRDRSVTCASCHLATHGFAHPDRGYGSLQRWDGSSASLEAFVLEPIGDRHEMGFSVPLALARLRATKSYQEAFAKAFASEPNETNLRRSLATFVRGIVRGDAPYDRFLLGEVDAMTPLERQGQWIFESKGGCWKCHTPPLFTDERFHNTGIGVAAGEAEAGRADVTNLAADTGKWKTPTLRGTRLTAPYMHDGSLPTLADVVQFYVRGGNHNPQLDRKLQKLDLSDTDQLALLAFLRSL